MKKIFILFAAIGLVALSSCEGDQGPPGEPGPLAEVYQVKGVSFTDQNGYSALITLDPTILSSDMVLLYRQDGTDNGAPVWKLTPELYYLADGTLDFGYNYNFTVRDVSVYMDGFDLANVLPAFRLNQTFRIVIIPGYSTGTAKTVNKSNFSDYNAVIKKYNIDDSKLKNIQL